MSTFNHFNLVFLQEFLSLFEQYVRENKPVKQPTAILPLPAEVMEKILSDPILGQPGDPRGIRTLLSCSQANKSLRSIALDDFLWRPHLKAVWSCGDLCLPGATSMNAYELFLYRVRLDTSAKYQLENLSTSTKSRMQHYEWFWQKNTGMNVYEALVDLTAKYADPTKWREYSASDDLWLSTSRNAAKVSSYLLRREGMRLLAESVRPDGAFEDLVTATLVLQGGVLSHVITHGLDSVAREFLMMVLYIGVPDKTLNPTYYLRLICTQLTSLLASPFSETAIDGDEDLQSVNLLLNSMLSPSDFQKQKEIVGLSLMCTFVGVLSRLGILAEPCNFSAIPCVIVKGFKHTGRDSVGDHLIPHPLYIDVISQVIYTKKELQIYHASHFPDMAPLGDKRYDTATAFDMIPRLMVKLSWELQLLPDSAPKDMVAAMEYAQAALKAHYTPIFANEGCDEFASLLHNHYPFDASALSEELCQIDHEDQVLAKGSLFLEAKEAAIEMDGQAPYLKRRTTFLLHKIGQIITIKRGHRRIPGVVVDWDARCRQTQEWQNRTRTDLLEHGSKQPFYQVLMPDGASWYVAEEKTEVVKEVPDALVTALLVKHTDKLSSMFRTFDLQRQKFMMTARTAEVYCDDVDQC